MIDVITVNGSMKYYLFVVRFLKQLTAEMRKLSLPWVFLTPWRPSSESWRSEQR